VRTTTSWSRHGVRWISTSRRSGIAASASPAAPSSRRPPGAGANTNTDTPCRLKPAGQNPADGALIHYRLTGAARDVSLEVLDGAGAVVRRYSNHDAPEPPVEGRNTPDYWLRAPQSLAATAGLHRFVWDLRHDAPAVASFSYPIAATFQATPQVPRGTVAARALHRASRWTAELMAAQHAWTRGTAGGLTQHAPRARSIRRSPCRRPLIEFAPLSQPAATRSPAAAPPRRRSRACRAATQLFGLVEGGFRPPQTRGRKGPRPHR
jgi:hypothetical protein